MLDVAAALLMQQRLLARVGLSHSLFYNTSARREVSAGPADMLQAAVLRRRRKILATNCGDNDQQAELSVTLPASHAFHCAPTPAARKTKRLVMVCSEQIKNTGEQAAGKNHCPARAIARHALTHSRSCATLAQRANAATSKSTR